MSEPLKIYAGCTLEWERTVASDYSADNGFALEYHFFNAQRRFSISGDVVSAVGDTFEITVPKATTATYLAGTYDWQCFATSTTERHLIAAGVCEVVPDPSSVTKMDGRSQVKRTLDALNAVIEKRASKDQMSMQIMGRSLGRMPIADLLMFRDKYDRLYRDELDAANVSAGLGSSKIILTRFRGV